MPDSFYSGFDRPLSLTHSNERYSEAAATIRANKPNMGDERIRVALAHLPGYSIELVVIEGDDMFAYVRSTDDQQLVRIAIKPEDYEREMNKLIVVLKRRANYAIKVLRN